MTASLLRPRRGSFSIWRRSASARWLGEKARVRVAVEMVEVDVRLCRVSCGKMFVCYEVRRKQNIFA